MVVAMACTVHRIYPELKDILIIEWTSRLAARISGSFTEVPY